MIFIAGWDKDDEEISNVKTSLFTHLSRWSINELSKYIDQDKYKIMADSAAKIKYDSLPFFRTMHYFVLKRKD